jgi:hypothetical protein
MHKTTDTPVLRVSSKVLVLVPAALAYGLGGGVALNLLGFFFSLGALRVLATASAIILIPVLALRFPPASQAKASVRGVLRVLKSPLVWLFGILLFFESGIYWAHCGYVG